MAQPIYQRMLIASADDVEWKQLLLRVLNETGVRDSTREGVVSTIVVPMYSIEDHETAVVLFLIFHRFIRLIVD